MSDTTTWPEWLTPEHTAIHNAIENQIKAALQHCIDSSDAAGQPWTTEGWISCSASNVISFLRQHGCPPLAVGEVERMPLPREEPVELDYEPVDIPGRVTDVMHRQPGDDSIITVEVTTPGVHAELLDAEVTILAELPLPEEGR